MNIKFLFIATVGFVMLWGCDKSTAPAEHSSDASQQLTTFIDDFISRQQPEDIRGFPGVSIDLSADAFAKGLEQTKAYLARLRTIDISELSIDEQIDWRFAASILRGQEIAQESIQSWKQDPRIYMQFANIGRVIE